MRTFSDILKDVDNSVTQKRVRELRDELFCSKYRFTEAEYNFGHEHIESKSKEILKRDIR